jgi:hypothetical protein
MLGGGAYFRLHYKRSRGLLLRLGEDPVVDDGRLRLLLVDDVVEADLLVVGGREVHVGGCVVLVVRECEHGVPRVHWLLLFLRE